MDKKILELMEKMGDLKTRLNRSSLNIEHKQYRQLLFNELFAVTQELNLYSDEEKRQALFSQKHKEIVTTFLAIDEDVKEVNQDENFFLILILMMILHNSKGIEVKAFLKLSIAVLIIGDNNNEKRFGLI